MAEKVTWTGKPTVLGFWEGLAVGILLIVFSVASTLSPFARIPAALYFLVAVAVGGIALIVFTFFVAYANTYTVTGRTARREFRFLVVRVEEAPTEKITDVVSHIGLVGRILKFGNLRVDTAGTPFAGVLFKGLRFKDLEEAKREVEKLVKREAT
ncbi:MAG: PH domain-containing protein [Candidatus Freyarchaeota archaeon]